MFRSLSDSLVGMSTGWGGEDTQAARGALHEERLREEREGGERRGTGGEGVAVGIGKTLTRRKQKKRNIQSIFAFSFPPPPPPPPWTPSRLSLSLSFSLLSLSADSNWNTQTHSPFPPPQSPTPPSPSTLSPPTKTTPLCDDDCVLPKNRRLAAARVNHHAHVARFPPSSSPSSSSSSSSSSPVDLARKQRTLRHGLDERGQRVLRIMSSLMRPEACRACAAARGDFSPLTQSLVRSLARLKALNRGMIENTVVRRVRSVTFDNWW